ncbi:MAG TPA: tetratricopeptide repeat protein [Tepidisphaeraceae bacterium]|nr:tetratricopeptide repeat protein [Tepidisphaeraceae bacterium]
MKIEDAIDLERQGKRVEAEELYRRIAEDEPTNAAAAHYLGILLHEQGRSEEAAAWLRRAIQVSPGVADLYSNLGVVLESLGRCAESIEVCTQAVMIDSSHVGAWYNLGNAYRRDGQFDIAIEAYQRALERRPDFMQAQSNIGATYRLAGRKEEAIAAYRAAVALAPNDAMAWNKLAQTLVWAGQTGEAIEAFRHASMLDPNLVEAHNDLAAALLDNNRGAEALEEINRALELRPEMPEALNNLGSALNQLGRHEEAIAAYRRAQGIRPDMAEAFSNMSIDLLALGRYDEAMAAVQKAIELRPDFAPAFNAMGNIFRDLGKFDEAAAAYQRSFSLRPDYVEGMSNLGNLFRDYGRANEAIACYQQALRIMPNYADAHNNLGSMYYDMGFPAEAAPCFQRAMQLRRDYFKAENNLGTAMKDMGQTEQARRLFEHALSLKPESESIHSNLVYCLHCMVGVSPEEIFQQHAEWGRRHAEPLRKHWRDFPARPAGDRPLRVGLVSPDLRMHSVAFFLLPLLERHDRRRVEFICYPTVPREDAVSEQLRKASEGWCSLFGKDDAAAVEQIRKDEIDILVDLAGHTARNRLMVFARRAAPVQATFLGYPNTTGMAAMDWRITDEIADPAGIDGLYTEKLWRLPRSAWCFSPLSGAPAIEPPRRDFISFGCFNDLSKVNEPLIDAWAKILTAVPDSRLLIKARGSSAGVTADWLRRLFTARHIDGRRVHLLQRQASADKHLECYAEVDIALDTFPYHGTTTTCEAIWMGVPVITRRGTAHVSLVGVSLLKSLGLDDLIAPDEEQYVRTAVELARDRRRLAELRSSLRQKMTASPLMDAHDYAAHVQSALEGMWRQRSAG